jgi:hypothetical protein
MRTPKALFIVLALAWLPLDAQQPPTTLNQALDRILSQERAEMENLQQYSPLVETYIQYLRPDAELGTMPNGDRYYLSRVELRRAVKLDPFADISSAGLRQFLTMIYIDPNGFDRQHYKFDYVRREFLGEVRCVVFDVTPLKGGKGRFVGRLWAEDHDYHIVRFNGAFVGSTGANRYFHFDSWRVNVRKNEWFPAYIYSEQGELHNAITEKLTFKAQTRLWGYNLGQTYQEQEFSKVRVESSTPVEDQTAAGRDLSPLQVQRTWDHRAEDNVTDRMQRIGLLGPPGEVDKVLETVVNNLEVTNNLDIEPEIRCRVLLTSTFESFTLGHTIVLSRGLLDVLPDEASLAAVLATELGHIVLGHRIDSQYAFFDRLLFEDKEAFRHFGFSRTPAEEQAAHQKAIDLLKNSPYKDELAATQMFAQALQSRSQEIPNLISPHLGDRVATGWTPAAAADSFQSGTKERNVIVALPLGARIKLNPWSDELQMMRSQPAGAISEREKMPFEITPFLPYLTREAETSPVRSEAAQGLSQAPRGQ